MAIFMAATNTGSQQDFARAFGDALSRFLTRNGISQSEAARQLGIETSEEGKRKGGARISSYCRDSKQGKRPKPDAEILYLVCTRFPGFSFIYKNYRISAETLNGNGAKSSEEAAEQLTLGLERQFDLTDKRGTVSVKVKRPPGRIEVSLSLEAKAL
jgi:transcriptional regulator with XRE-family HTH domain